ncbi:hypothetical protein LguiA_029741 [Lonicera macranthoides]
MEDGQVVVPLPGYDDEALAAGWCTKHGRWSKDVRSKGGEKNMDMMSTRGGCENLLSTKAQLLSSIVLVPSTELLLSQGEEDIGRQRLDAKPKATEQKSCYRLHCGPRSSHQVQVSLLNHQVQALLSINFQVAVLSIAVHSWFNCVLSWKKPYAKALTPTRAPMEEEYEKDDE